MKETITIRLDEDLMKKLRRDAQRDNRSVNNYIETVLKRHYQEIEQKETPTD